MIQIGITYYPGEDARTSGKNQTALTLAEMLASFCHVTLVNPKDDGATWWDSLPTLSGVKLKSVSSLDSECRLDYLIDVDGLLHPDKRIKIATRIIVFLRTFLQFSEMDVSVYPEINYVPRYIDDVYEVWCWDILNPPATLDCVRTMFICPIRTVPFVWSPFLVSDMGVSVKKDGSPWIVHVAEKNRENTSSCVMPLVAIRELYQRHVIDAIYKVHNVDHIKDHKFLQENIFRNIQLSTLPVELVTHEGYHTWTGGNHALFSHSRFKPLRMNLLYAIWLGLPVIHNSPIIASLHPLLEGMTYTGNQVGGICAAFRYLVEHHADYSRAREAIRTEMITRWGIPAFTNAWKAVIESLPVSDTKEVTAVQNDVIRIAFSDMWPGFNYDINFLTDCLRHELKNTGIKVKGAMYSAECVPRPHVIVVGPYSTEWKKIPAGIPKIYFTAENWPIPSDPSIALYLTPSRIEDDSHFHLPTWMTFIDWFSGSKKLPVGCEDNPIRLPVWFAMNPHPVGFTDRPDFCGFVVSNPICAMRNETFHAVNQYKHVDSGGQLYNNIGGALALKYPGGGCGDISKHHFFASHRFTISFENSQAPGYITEKVLHAKMAGCVPLYWGDASTDTDFVRGSIVNLSHVKEAGDVVTVLQKLEEQPDLCAKIASTPILNEEKKEKALRLLSSMCQRVLSIIHNRHTESHVITSTLPAKIDKIFIINLDIRHDRWENLMDTEPYLESMVTRIPGVNGKTLSMSSFIYKMFEKNEFNWKKSVIGCNLSHITAWSRVLQEATGDYFLILEDDVRFTKGWREAWAKCADTIPLDADLLYLGGVLPPNKRVLDSALEHVNHHWVRIKPNTYFSPVPAPVFHFCAYSYVLTRSGAKKLLDYLTHSDRKCFTVSDHLLGSPQVGLVKYITQPLLSYCFQEDDPVYVQSQFNDLHRKDTFDSDIWNNTECFTEEEIAPFRPGVAAAEEEKTMDVYYYQTPGKGKIDLYEHGWLEDMFQTSIRLVPITDWSFYVPDGAFVLVQRPHSVAFHAYFTMLQEKGVSFRVLHLSDEFGQDCIDFYTLPRCKAVVRNYWRKDVPSGDHILTIPLGYRHRTNEATPFELRKLVWSFHGTGWFDRQTQLTALQVLTPHQCLILPNWNHPNQLGAKDYCAMIGKSKFIPILRGNNTETFRIYEALEAGAIPIMIRGGNNDPFYTWVRKTFNMQIFTPEEALSTMQTLLLSSGSTYQCELADTWTRIKQDIQENLKRLIH